MRITTNWKDRYFAWMQDPDRPENPTLLDAFLEGFTQAIEATHDSPRGKPGPMQCSTHGTPISFNLNGIPICPVPECVLGAQSLSRGTHPQAGK